MYYAAIYSKKHQTAYVVLGPCKNADDVIFEINLFQEVAKIEVPAIFQTQRIALMKWQGYTVIKFYLHPATLFAHHGPYNLDENWQSLDDNPDLLQYLQVKKPEKTDK